MNYFQADGKDAVPTGCWIELSFHQMLERVQLPPADGKDAVSAGKSLVPTSCWKGLGSNKLLEREKFPLADERVQLSPAAGKGSISKSCCNGSSSHQLTRNDGS